MMFPDVVNLDTTEPSRMVTQRMTSPTTLQDLESPLSMQMNDWRKATLRNDHLFLNTTNQKHSTSCFHEQISASYLFDI